MERPLLTRKDVEFLSQCYAVRLLHDVEYDLASMPELARRSDFQMAGYVAQGAALRQIRLKTRELLLQEGFDANTVTRVLAV